MYHACFAACVKHVTVKFCSELYSEVFVTETFTVYYEKNGNFKRLVILLFTISEQEIMDVIADSAENNTLLKRDTVFAQMNFCLKSGLFKLVTGEEPKSPKESEGKSAFPNVTNVTKIKVKFTTSRRNVCN